MRVLVDVNVFLDVLTRRRDWAGSLQVLHLLRHVPALDGWSSALATTLRAAVIATFEVRERDGHRLPRYCNAVRLGRKQYAAPRVVTKCENLGSETIPFGVGTWNGVSPIALLVTVISFV
jgi:hypothetical protein